LMIFLYTVFITLSLPLIALWLLVIAYCHPSARAHLLERLRPLAPPTNCAPTLWVHACSVGEYYAVLPLIQRYQQQYPHHQLLITTTHPAARALICQDMPAALVHDLPIDHPLIMQQFIARYPLVAVWIVETELWPGMWHALHCANVDFVILNARMSPRSFARWRRARRLIQPMLHWPSAILCKSHQDYQHFRQLAGPNRPISITGNLKLANIDQAPHHCPPHPITLLIVSSHPPEHAMLVRLCHRLQQKLPSLRIIIAPRHPESVDLLHEQAQCLHGPIQRHSTHQKDDDFAVLLVDQLGCLDCYYPIATVVIVGGSWLPHGGQNPLEAIAYGKPILHGPSVHNFTESYEWIDRCIPASCCDLLDLLEHTAHNWLSQPHVAQQIGHLLHQHAARHSQRVMQHYLKHLHLAYDPITA